MIFLVWKRSIGQARRSQHLLEEAAGRRTALEVVVVGASPLARALTGYGINRKASKADVKLGQLPNNSK